MRTLTAILQNGEIQDSPSDARNRGSDLEDDGVGQGNTLNPQVAMTTMAEEARMLPLTEAMDPLVQTVEGGERNGSEQVRPPLATNADAIEDEQNRDDGNHHDGLIRFGMAALSVVVGGILLSRGNEGGNQGGNGQHDRRSQSENGEAEGPTENNGSTVVIEEIQEETDQDWVSVPQ